MIRKARRWSAALLALGGMAGGLGAQAVEEPAWEARIWLDRGNDPVVDRGDKVRVYYRTALDSYVSIFHIDTNGGVRLLYPASPDVDHFVPGGRDYRLLFPRSSSWLVDDDPGVGYFFILAAPEPQDFRDFRYSWSAGSWDLSFVGRTVTEDPFVAMDAFIERLIPDWEYAEYGLDWVEYDVGQDHDYPRFLCYDCHGFQPYSTWNPYLSACTSFRMVIYDDPWYYPAYRYRGARVVWARPPVWQQPRFIFRTRRGGEPFGPLVQPRPSDGSIPGVTGSAAPRRSGAGIGSGGTVVTPGRRGAVGTTTRTRPTATPLRRSGGATRGGTVDRRTPSSVTPQRRGGTSTGAERARPSTERTRPTTSRTRPTAERTRPSTTRSGTPTREERKTPVLQRRSSGSTTVRPPTSRTESTTRTRPNTTRTQPNTTRTRPSTRSLPRERGNLPNTRSVPNTRRTQPSTTRSRPPAARSGGSGSARVRTQPRSGGSSRVRTPARSSTTRARPPSRSSGGSVRRTPPRSSGGGASVRSRPPRSSGSVRSGSSGSRSSRPRPVRRKPGGGRF